MATASRPPGDGTTADVARHRSDRSPWNWLLLVGIVLPLIVPFYNRTEPELFGWPFFYWFQLALVGIGVITTVIVYRMTRRSRDDQQAARDAIARDRER
jgi:uncharacterized membrane protein